VDVQPTYEPLDTLHAIIEARPARTWLAPHTWERAVKKTQPLEKRYDG
jgi:hypothetical protein